MFPDTDPRWRWVKGYSSSSDGESTEVSGCRAIFRLQSSTEVRVTLYELCNWCLIWAVQLVPCMSCATGALYELYNWCLVWAVQLVPCMSCTTGALYELYNWCKYVSAYWSPHRYLPCINQTYFSPLMFYRRNNMVIYYILREFLNKSILYINIYINSSFFYQI